MTDDLFVDRTNWDRGAWDNEPDRVEWRDKRATPILPCLIVRGPSGALCGYVGVPPGHPWHGKDYDHVGANVHGGLTYSEICQGRICHVARSGESEPWWLGFDCAHCDDLCPGSASRRGTPLIEYYGEVYRDIKYVRREVERLADQARAAVKP